MLIFRGKPALSDFRLASLLKTSSAPEATNLTAEFYYFVDYDHKEKLSSEEIHKLQQLIDAELINDFTQYHTTTIEPHWLVCPRIGTISPWSTKATNIMKHCQLQKINRIERGVLYQIHSKMNSDQLHSLSKNLYDPMTQTLLSIKDITIFFSSKKPKPIRYIPFNTEGRNAFVDENQQFNLGLSEDEINYLTKWYEQTHRNPSDAELMMFAQANSEHCRHKIFNSHWKNDDSILTQTLFSMIKSTAKASSSGILSAYHDNAAVIEGYAHQRFYPEPTTRRYRNHSSKTHILAKVETHNHPTAISPKAGAATGAGGEIRDEGATGIGGKPKAGLVGYHVSNLNIPNHIRSWELSSAPIPPHIASPLTIMLEAPLGAANYNNEFGRPNLVGYFRTYENQLTLANHTYRLGYHKPVMIAGGIGNIEEQHITKMPIDKPSKIIVLGGAAMKIGLGGGAASSSHTSSHNTELDFASVQRDNPEMERRCQEVLDRCWQLGNDNPIAFIHDVGAGGLSNAIPELLKDSKCGGTIDLRKIPCDEAELSPMEIWCNESQERYVLAIPTGNPLQTFEMICQHERCPFAIIGETDQSNHLVVYDLLFDNEVISINLNDLIGNLPPMLRSLKKQSYDIKGLQLDHLPIQEAIHKVLQLPSVASKLFLITIGDRSVSGLVHRDQLVGPWQIPVADCCITLSNYHQKIGEAMSVGERSPLAVINGPASARMAIGEAITNISCAPIKNISDIKLSANWMAAANHPGENERLYTSVKAVTENLCPQLGIAIPVGKDSLSMQVKWKDEHSNEQSVTSPLTLVASAFAPVYNCKLSITPQLEPIDSHLLFIDLGKKKNRLAGSALAQVYQQTGLITPDLDNPTDLLNFFNTIQTLMNNQLITAYHDRSDGGLITTLLEMSFASKIGLTVNLDVLTTNDPIATLFNEELGAVIQIPNNNLSLVKKIIDQHHLTNYCHHISTIYSDTIEKEITIRFKNEIYYSESCTQLERIWSETSYLIQSIRNNPQCAQQEYDNLLDNFNPGINPTTYFNWPTAKEHIPNINQHKKPIALILREQGVNGHIEMAAAFYTAGFEVYDLHMSELLERPTALSQANVLVACGGFSYGDVLGAGKGWAYSILYNDQLKKIFSQFFNRENTLTLGVCNGCQMLSNLKTIIPGAENWPQFLPNQSEQFEARFSMVKINANGSAWFNNMQHSILPVAISHGEGRATFNQPTDYANLINHQQITIAYSDNHGNHTQRYPYNPNGSQQSVAGVCSKDGRVSIMMPHPERVFTINQLSWAPKNWKDYEFSPWLQLFLNARNWLND